MHADREIKEERDHHRRSDNDRHHDREGTILTPKLKINNNCYLEVNLFQKHLFLHQLTHNLAKDCFLIYQFSKLRTCCVHKLF